MIKMTFIGLGQAGGRMVDTFLEQNSNVYSAMAINTAVNDLKGLKNVPMGDRLALEGNSYGAARTPDIAKAALMENAFEVGEKARAVSQGSDFVWLVAGLGGGTGTGCLDFMLDYVDGIFELPVGLIVTIPRDDDSAIQKMNAVGALAKIHAAMVDERIRSVLIVDNQQFYQSLIESKNQNTDWRDMSNKSLAKTLHELNAITESSGSSNFDRADLLNFLSYSGCLVIGRDKLRKTDSASVVETIRGALTSGFFSTGYRFNEAKSFSLCFTLNKEGASVRSAAFEKNLTQELTSMSPHLLDTYFGYYTGDSNNVLILAAGLGFPERADRLKEQIKDVRPAEIKSFEVSDIPSASQFSGLLKRSQSSPGAVEDNPFKNKQAQPAGGKVPNGNPFLKKQK